MKHLIFFSLYSMGILVLHILNILSPMFSGINNKSIFFFGFSNLSFFVFVFTTLKNKIFIFKCFYNLFDTVRSKNNIISQEVLCDYQINLGNTANLTSSLFGGRYSMFPGREENLIWGNLAFYGRT